MKLNDTVPVIVWSLTSAECSVKKQRHKTSGHKRSGEQIHGGTHNGVAIPICHPAYRCDTRRKITFFYTGTVVNRQTNSPFQGQWHLCISSVEWLPIQMYCSDTHLHNLYVEMNAIYTGLHLTPEYGFVSRILPKGTHFLKMRFHLKIGKINPVMEEMTLEISRTV